MHLVKVSVTSTRFASRIASGWKKIALVWAIATLLGFVTAAAANGDLGPLATRAARPRTATVALQVTPANPDAEEISRLKTRNRRLEALVEVLQQRKLQHGAQHDPENHE